MNLKKIVTLGITAAIAASTIAVTALTSVNGFDKPYKPGYSYAYTGNSYTRMDYSEKGNFVMTRAKNKKSTKLYPKLFVIVRDYKLDEVDSSKEYRELAKNDDDATYSWNNYTYYSKRFQHECDKLKQTAKKLWYIHRIGSDAKKVYFHTDVECVLQLCAVGSAGVCSIQAYDSGRYYKCVNCQHRQKRAVGLRSNNSHSDNSVSGNACYNHRQGTGKRDA